MNVVPLSSGVKYHILEDLYP